LSSTCPPATSLRSYEITLFNCQVVHVETGTVLPQHQCVVIDHYGRIAHIVPDEKDDDDGDDDDDDSMSRHRWIATSRTSLDCQGGYLIPGFIDCHVHVTGMCVYNLNGVGPSCWVVVLHPHRLMTICTDGALISLEKRSFRFVPPCSYLFVLLLLLQAFTANFGLLEQTSPTYVTACAIPALEAMLQRGFTTVRDAGGADHGLAQAIEEGYICGPRLLFCGKALSQTGGHGDMRLPGNFAKALSLEGCGCCAGLGRVCDGDAEVRRAVRDEVRKGATHIKVMAGGGVSSPTDRITSTQFSLAELQAIVEEASAANLPVMAHAYTSRAILKAVQAGVTSIEHGNLLTDEAAQVMAHAGTYLVPTLVTYEQLALHGEAQGLRPEMVAKVYDVLEAGKRSIAIAQRAGVIMCFGTDCLAEMRQAQLREFALLHDAGMSLVDCLRSATVHAAQLIQRPNELGCIQVNAIADLIVLRENPLESIRVYEEWDAQCLAILKNGKVVRSQR
jgi:imidazolonepropionase-like amidohydrolase